MVGYSTLGCGRPTKPSPNSYWYNPDGTYYTQYPNARNINGYLQWTAVESICGKPEFPDSHVRLCIDCIRRLGILW